MRTVLISLRQWGIVSPPPVDDKDMILEEVKAQEAWGEIHEMLAFMEISIRTVESALNVLVDTQNLNVTWGILEQGFGAI